MRAVVRCALVLGVLFAGPDPSSAQSIDPAVVHRARVGAGSARSVRVDPGRSGRAPSALPVTPTVAWRKVLPGPLAAPPVVAADGRIALVLGGNGEVRLFSAAGDDLGAAQIKEPAAEAAPAFLADGTLVVLTASGHAAFVGPDRELRRRVALGIRSADALAPIPTPSGGVVFAGGRAVLELDADGRVIGHTALADAVSAPPAVRPAIGGGHEVLLATPRGDLLAVRAPLGPRRVTAMGGTAFGGLAVGDDGSVWGVVGGALLRVQRRGGAVPWRANATSGVLAALHSPALLSDGAVAFVGVDGSLVVLEPSGEVRHRVALDRAAPPPLPGTTGPGTRIVAVEEGPPLLADAAGRIAFARPSGRVGVVGPDGLVAVASERLCATPNGLAPLGPGTFVVGCAEGAIVAVGDGGAGAAPAAD